MFTSGSTFTQFPVKVLYKFVDHQQDARLQAGVSVSSKKFKKAVDRNRIKRLLREAYRTQKPDIPDGSINSGYTLCLFFIYIGKELPAYDDVFTNVGKVLSRVIDTIGSQKNKT